MGGLVSDFDAINTYISNYRLESVVRNRALTGTGVVGSVDVLNQEGYTGTLRYLNQTGPLNYSDTQTTTDTHINYGTETAVDGLVSQYDTETATFIKTYRTHGANEYNLTGEIALDNPTTLEYIGSMFGREVARDIDDTLLQTLKSVVYSEVLASGRTAYTDGNDKGQIRTNPRNDDAGFYFDVNRATDNAVVGSSRLIDTSVQGGLAAQSLLQARQAGFGDAGITDRFYLVVDSDTQLDLQVSNILTSMDRISGSSTVFNTILGAAFQVVVSDNISGDDFDFNAVGVGDTDQAINAGSKRTSFLIRQGAIGINSIPLVGPSIDRDKNIRTGGGMGSQEIFQRWSYLLHPTGYTWDGSDTAIFERESAVNTAAGRNTIVGVHNTGTAGSPYTRRSLVGNLSILPIFHA